MHALGRFIQQQMDAPGRGWKQADLARHSGVSPQVVSSLLAAERTTLARPPSKATIEGLAKAFGGGQLVERRLWLRVAESMGMPVGSEVVATDPSALTNDELLDEVRRRLSESPAVVVPYAATEDPRPGDVPRPRPGESEEPWTER